MLPQWDTLKLSIFQFPRWGSRTVEYYFHTVQNRLFITTKLSIFSISSQNVDFDEISKNFQRFVLVQDWKSSSSWVFSVQMSTTLHVRSIWKLRFDCNSLGIWVIGPARFAACWPLFSNDVSNKPNLDFTLLENGSLDHALPIRGLPRLRLVLSKSWLTSAMRWWHGRTTRLDVMESRREWPRVLAHDFAVGRRRSGGRVAETETVQQRQGVLRKPKPTDPLPKSIHQLRTAKAAGDVSIERR